MTAYDRPLSAAKRALLERRLRGDVPGVSADAATAIPRRDESAPVPLTSGQERLWFLDQLVPGSAAANINHALRLDFPLDPTVLGRALGEIVRRHAVLRTTFVAHGGRPRQVIGAAPDVVDVPVVDLAAVDRAAREAEVTRLATEEARAPFDLAAGPLLRARLLRLGGREWVFLLTIHHIAADGWSMRVLFDELRTLYDAFAAGRPSPLPALPIQYADYAVWQRQWLGGARLERHLAYWREKLRELPVLELATDRPRPRVQSFAGATHSVPLPPALAAGVRALAQRSGTTPFMVLLAAFQGLLARYTGQTDVVVGSYIAGRTRAELEPLIGFFVNTLVLRTDLGGDPRGVELLARVRETALGAYAHQDVPFERLVEELQPARDPGRNPLCQVAFQLFGAQGARRAAATASDATDGAPVLVEVERGTAAFDLVCNVVEHGEALWAHLEYDTALFDAATIARLARHYETLLGSLVADPERRLPALPLMDGEERRQVVEAWNATDAPIPAWSVPARFAAQAAATPDAVAFVAAAAGDGAHGAAPDETVTCAALAREVRRLAGRLRAAGVRRGARVGVCLSRSPAAAAALLAVWELGGVYVPLDPGYPAGRLAFMAADAGLGALVTDGAHAGRVPLPAGAAVVRVDEGGVAADAVPDEHVDAPAPDDLAYVVYTSGSTGQPKGVAVPHRVVTNRLAWMWEAYPFGPDEVACHRTALSFVDSLWELLGALLCGRPTVIVSEEVGRDPAALVRTLADHGVTRLWVVPALLAALLDGVPGLGAQLPRLTFWVSSGEPLTAALLARFGRAVPHAALFNLYGTSEVWDATWYTPRPGDGAAFGGRVPPGQVPIGQPIRNVRAYVLDAAGQPVPVGVPGELHIGGAGVAAGYVDRPALTDERFVPDPFRPAPGAVLYRTGDRARWRADGVLECLGRIDQQVKVRGHRVEPAELESVLEAAPEVRRAAAAVHGGADGGESRLVAYVVLAEGMDEGAAIPALRERLARALPDYMLPSAIVSLARLPLTPSGKVDRRALPAPDAARPALAAAYVAPRTPTEEVLCWIWAEVLGLERVGVDDHFFELGGHSLLATQVAARVRDALGSELPLRLLFEHPTVARLAAEVDRLRGGEPASGDAEDLVAGAANGGPAPLTSGQERLWFLDQLVPGSAAANINHALRLDFPLEPTILARAIAGIVGRHAVLRTTFVAHGGAVRQVIGPPPETVDVPVEDLRALAPAAREAEVARLATVEARTPFDLAAGPLLRVRLLRLGGREWVFLLTIHHIVTDGWSMRLFYDEMRALYDAFAAGRPSPLPPLPLQYADYAVWQRRSLDGARLERQLAYWRQKLAALPTLELPTDRPRPRVQSFAGATHGVTLPPALAAGVRALAQRSGATPFMVLLGAFQGLLARYTGQTDIAVGSYIAGRTRRELEGLIGFFLNTLVLRTDLGGDPTGLELLARVRETALDAYAHQDVPFERLVEELQPERDPSRNPLCQVAFQLLNVSAPRARPSPAPDEGGASLLDVERGTATFDLVCNFVDHGEALHAQLEYNTDLFDAATIARLARHYETLLGSLVAEPERRLSALELLTGEERARLLDDWNATGAPIPPASVPALLAAQAARTPDAVAFLHEGATCTYAALAACAAGIARRLRAAGVGPGVRVGVCLARSPGAAAALLAIWEAGGVYVPLDASYPAGRLAFMAADARLAVLVTDGAHMDRVPLPAGAAIVRVDDAPGEGPAIADVEAVPHEPAPEDEAYVVYTSGSTGQPKGVAVPHRVVLNRLAWMWEAYPFGPDEVACHRTALSFVDALWELLGALLCGRPTVIVSEEAGRDPAALVRTLADHGVTRLWVVPALLAALLDALPALGAQLPRLTFWVSSGEPLAAALLARFARAVPHATLFNLYGTSEVWDATWYTPRPGDGAAPGGRVPPGQVPIGRPIRNVRTYVLDGAGQPVPVGVPGELHIGGAGVARGYVNRPELTAERFVPDPFAPEDGAVLYRTGDRARWRADRVLECLGRLDQQVKVRGHRVEPGEIESVLEAAPEVRRAAATVQGGADGREARLVGYVVLADGADEQAVLPTLRERLARALPEYMVPSVIVPLAALPLTPSGKVDRRALPAPDAARPALAADYVAPRAGIEEALCGIWAEVLGLERVGVDDHFFELGGHSLLATQVVARARAALGVEVPLRLLFEAPTVAQLAAAVERLGGMAGEPGDAIPSLEPLDSAAVLARLEELSDEEVAASLEALLAREPVDQEQP